VSYSFKKGAESKYMRFGFIADELESVVPQVVRNVGNRNRADFDDQKAVVYQDLIALLVAATQSQSSQIEDAQAKIEDAQVKIATLEDAQALQSKQMSELITELWRMKQARRSQEEERAHLVTGAANATQLANETDQNVTNTTENATGELNFTNATGANISDKTTQTRLRKP